MPTRRAIRVFAAAFAVSMLAACGNKGPLVRPAPPPGSQAPPPPPAQNDSVPIPGSPTN